MQYLYFIHNMLQDIHISYHILPVFIPLSCNIPISSHIHTLIWKIRLVDTICKGPNLLQCTSYLLTLFPNYQCWGDPLIIRPITWIGMVLSARRTQGLVFVFVRFQFVLSS